MPIMYVCESCEVSNPEGCGHFDRSDLRIAPNGTWVCFDCFDDLPCDDLGIDADEVKPMWSELAVVPAYVAVSA